MTEKALHNLWRKKLLPINGLKTTDGRELSIIHFGYYNSSLSGPDFSMGIIMLEGVQLIGPIEIHIKSSDWYNHKHQNDPAYQNVALHVVFKHDQDVIIKDNYRLPTLELSQWVSVDNLSLNDEQLNRPCIGLLDTVPIRSVDFMKRIAILLKWREKIKQVDAKDWKKSIKQLLAIRFSSKVNDDAFKTLLDRVMNESSMDKFPGLIQFASQLSWRRKGVRPSSFPEIRIPQFILCCLIINQLQTLKKFNMKDVLRKVNNELVNRDLPVMTNDFIDSIRINCEFPFLFWFMKVNEKELFDQLTKFKQESNVVVRQVIRDGFKVNNAFDSQALIALNNYYCNNKKCLSCVIGKTLLNRE